MDAVTASLFKYIKCMREKRATKIDSMNASTASLFNKLNESERSELSKINCEFERSELIYIN